MPINMVGPIPPSFHMEYISNYHRLFISCCHCLHFKPIIRSLVLSDALHPTITMSFKLKGKNNDPLVSGTLDEDYLGVGIELKSLTVNK